MSDNLLVFSFGKEHPIGSVCMFPCVYCGDIREAPELSTFTARDGGELLPFQPLKIVREASRADYMRQCKQTNAVGSTPKDGYYYFVHTD